MGHVRMLTLNFIFAVTLLSFILILICTNPPALSIVVILEAIGVLLLSFIAGTAVTTQHVGVLFVALFVLVMSAIELAFLTLSLLYNYK